MKIFCLVSLFVLLNFNSALAKEMARPSSMGGDYLLELNSGVVFENSEDVFELGFDLERFIDGTHHHFSLGFASEVEFKEHSDEYFFGPLLSAYYLHFKGFVTSGLLTDFSHENQWKTRIGIGYEIIWLPHWLLVPTIAMDFIDSHIDPAITIGLACEF